MFCKSPVKQQKGSIFSRLRTAPALASTPTNSLNQETMILSFALIHQFSRDNLSQETSSIIKATLNVANTT